MSDRPLPPIVIPETVQQEWTTAVRSVLERVQAPPAPATEPAADDGWLPPSKHPPDLIVRLLRSAIIPFTAVAACARANGIPLPPTIDAHIGSELFQEFKRQYHLGTGRSFMILTDAQRARFRAWLDADAQAQQVVRQMQQDAGRHGVQPQRVLIFDDLQYGGGTLHAASHLVQGAFPGAVVDVEVAGYTGLFEIVRATLADEDFDEETEQNAYQFLYDLLKGYRVAGDRQLIAIDTVDELRRLGQQEPHRSQGIYPRLAAIYGDEALLHVPHHVLDAVRAWGRTVNPVRPAPLRTALLLTGPPGVGKTTIIRQLLSQLQVAHLPGLLPASGFYTEELRDGQGNRLGFELLTLSGERALLASRPGALPAVRDFADPLPFGRYVVDRAALEQTALPTLTRAWSELRLAVVDEIGPMELLSDGFRGTVWQLVDGGLPLVGTIVGRSHPFADRLKAHPRVELLEVTVENRDTLPGLLTGRLRERFQGWTQKRQPLFQIFDRG